MISRKRRKSPTPAASEIPSKRARILSNIWHSDESISVDTACNKETPQRIRATRVIGETPGKDTRKREDDYTTGLKHTSSRHPRQTHTDAAIETDGLNHFNSSGQQKSSRQLIRERGDNSVEFNISRRKRPERVIDTHPHPNNSKTNSLQTKTLGDFVRLSSSATLPGFTVQISPHSSFERDQYILYQSSLSTQGALSSLPPHQDSGLGESSPSSILISEKADQNGIVPDSQSLAGSFSYVPSTSASEGTSSYQSARDFAIARSSCIADSLDLDSSRRLATEVTRTGDAPSSSVVSTSANLVISSQRSRSVPPQSSSVASRKTSSRRAATAQLSRSVSDPGLVVPDSLDQVALSELVQTPTQGEKAPSGRKNLTTNTHHSNSSQNFGSSSPYLEFQTQISIVLDSQTTQASTDLVEENWQSGQIIPSNSISASQVSSESIVQSTRRQFSAFPGAFVISEDPAENSQATQATESSTLSQRDPNSQTDRHLPSAQVKRDATVQSIDSLDPDIENVSNSLLSHDSSRLLGTPGSGSPPSFLSSTMSDREPAPSSSVTMPDRQPPPSGFFSRPSQQATNTGPPIGFPSARSSMPHRVPPQAGYFLGKTPSIHMAGTPPASGLSEPGISDRESARASRMPSSRPLPMAGVSGAAAGPPVSLRERLREMRATSKANVTPRRFSVDQRDSERATKSPSITVEKSEVQPQEEQPRIEVRPLRVPVEMPLPVRAVQPPPPPPPQPPHAPTYPSKLSYHTEASYSQKSTRLTPVHLKEMEFVIPLSMNPRVRDQYISTINYYQRDIEKFMKERAPSTEVVGKIRAMLDRVKQVTTHIDLDGGGGITQGQEAAEDEAQWAETCSAKFLFLRHFLDALRYFDVHIAIVARSGQLHDIIETFLKGTHTKYSRPETVSRSEPNVSRGRLEVTLVASGEDGASSLPKTANLVIAFDGSFNAQDVQVGILRGHLLNVGQLSPVIHLLVYKSAEHIERCLPESMNEVERLRRIVSCMTQTRHDVGQLLPDEANTAAVAEEAAAFLELGGLERDWTFPSIRAIENIETIEFQNLVSTNQSENQMSMEQNTASQNLALKRALDMEEEFSAPLKRQRSTQIGDITHVSDSMFQESHSTDTMTTAMRRQLESEITNLKAERDRMEYNHTTLLSERDALYKESSDIKGEITFLKSERLTLRSDKETLQAELEKSHKFAKDLEDSLNDLQTRFEDKNRKCQTLRYDKNDLSDALETAKRRQALHATEIAKLTNSRTNLEQELKSARALLVSSETPSIAELEAVNSEVRTLRAANASLEKKAASQAHDIDYMRTQYQNASADLNASATQIGNLQRDLEVAQRQAQGEATRLAQMNRTEETNQAFATVERQRLELASRERLLQKQAEDLKEFKDFKRGRGGVITRGSSVQAKSPRGGSRAGSPGVGGSGYGGKVGGSGLRYGGGIGGDGR